MFDDILPVKKKSYYLDGFTCYTQITDDDFTFSGSDFTVDYWIKYDEQEWKRVFKTVKGTKVIEILRGWECYVKKD